MFTLKKLIFAPVVLVLLVSLTYLYTPLLNQYLEVFIKPWGGLFEFGTIAILILLTSLVYCLYLTFTQNIKFSLGLAVVSALIPFLFLKPQLGLVLGIGFFLSFIMCHFMLQANLKSYVNFQPAKLLSSPIKTLNTFLLLTLTFGYFLTVNSIIQTQGFKVPETMIDWAVDISLNQAGLKVKGEKYLAQGPTLTPEQLQLLEQNPQVLEEFGLSSDDIDQFVQPENSPEITPNKNAVSIIPSLNNSLNLKDIAKAQVSDSLEKMIKPYLFAIPFVLGFLFYSIASFCLWILSLFLTPVLMFIFYFFEKSGFIKFTNETRVVKKIII